MPKLGLALSGGGFRATLYHLGVVRFLRDAGALQNVTDIASVSGGSILAAHLVLNWDRYNGDDANFAAAASEIVKFVQFDLRNHIVRRLPLQVPFRLLAKLRFLDRRQYTPNALLEGYYKKYLYGDRCLHELPEQPMLHMLATNVSTGALSAFNRKGLFIQMRGVDGSRPFAHVPGQLASISRAVGASSAFPGFFPPVEITAADRGVRDGQFPTEVSYEGLEIISHSRIYDLRHWDPDAESLDRQGHVYVRDRIEMKLLESYRGDGHVTFSVPNRMENVEFRQPAGGIRGIISRVAEPTDERGLSRTIYEFEYDLSQALPEEPVTIDVELIGNVPKTVKAPFVTHTQTDLISVWLLFPADRPYRTYSLVSYPVDRSLAPRPMTNRFAIDHPYGFLIGWSVVNPDPDRVYECRWTSD